MSKIVDPDIEAYAAAHASPLDPILDELAAVTRERTTAPNMMVGPIEGAFLRLLVRLMGARRVVEIGTFTGFSGLCIASALPEDGKLVTCELSDAHADIASSFFARTPLGKKIELRRGRALDTLRSLPTGDFDMVFIDADKEGYLDYYEEALRLLRHGGLVVADNTLWSGRVLDPKEPSDRALADFNEVVKNDPRVEQVLLTVRDGILLARKLALGDQRPVFAS
ncbi:MAG TPA: class I SAM-dependent methyltransferase [Fredinandcohnia sp.]|nr:class I SAM-dependent methyltransferase [Fredinandcohnia sp.]